jgi:hypothetical protein
VLPLPAPPSLSPSLSIATQCPRSWYPVWLLPGDTPVQPRQVSRVRRLYTQQLNIYISSRKSQVCRGPCMGSPSWGHVSITVGDHKNHRPPPHIPSLPHDASASSFVFHGLSCMYYRKGAVLVNRGWVPASWLNDITRISTAPDAQPPPTPEPSASPSSTSQQQQAAAIETAAQLDNSASSTSGRRGLFGFGSFKSSNTGSKGSSPSSAKQADTAGPPPAPIVTVTGGDWQHGLCSCHPLLMLSPS